MIQVKGPLHAITLRHRTERAWMDSQRYSSSNLDDVSTPVATFEAPNVRKTVPTVVADEPLPTDIPFPPLTRRWTFSGGDSEGGPVVAGYMESIRPSPPRDESRKKPLSDPPRSDTPTSQTSSISDVTPTVRNGDSRRELRKASVAQELSEAVAKLLIATPEFIINACDEADQLAEARRLARDHFSKLPSRYALSVDAHDVVTHMRLMQQSRAGDRVYVDVKPSEWEPGEDARSVITLSCRDRPNLLDSITHVISRLSSTILDADCMTSRDGLTLDRFEVQHKSHAMKHNPASSSSSSSSSQEADSPPRRHEPEFIRMVLEAALNGESVSQFEEDLSGRGSNRSSDSPKRSITNPQKSETPRSHPVANAHRRRRSSSTGSVSSGSEEEIPFEEIQLLETVASGTSGTLHRARWNDEMVAVKVIKAPESGEKMESFLADFERERAIVRGLRHPNLCRLYGVSSFPGSCCLVYDFLEGGSLATLLRDRARPYDLFSIALDVAEGMDYLHKKGVMHRDLKSDNILLNKEGRAVVADFGLVCPTITVKDHTGETGTYRWMAPEVIRHEPYSTSADVYSFGVVLWELLTRDQPFRGMTPIQAAFAVARQGARPPLPHRTPPSLAELIRLCWHDDPLRRPTFTQVVRALKAIRLEILGPTR